MAKTNAMRNLANSASERALGGNLLSASRDAFLRRTFNFWQALSIHVTPNHFYAPIPDTRTLTDRLWSSRLEAPGLDFDEPGRRSPNPATGTTVGLPNTGQNDLLIYAMLGIELVLTPSWPSGAGETSPTSADDNRTLTAAAARAAARRSVPFLAYFVLASYGCVESITLKIELLDDGWVDVAVTPVALKIGASALPPMSCTGTTRVIVPERV